MTIYEIRKEKYCTIKKEEAREILKECSMKILENIKYIKDALGYIPDVALNMPAKFNGRPFSELLIKSLSSEVGLSVKMLTYIFENLSENANAAINNKILDIFLDKDSTINIIKELEKAQVDIYGYSVEDATTIIDAIKDGLVTGPVDSVENIIEEINKNRFIEDLLS